MTAVKDRQEEHRVPVHVHSEDRIIDISFDAAPWLAQARDKDIKQLALCGWFCCRFVDPIMAWATSRVPEIRKLIDHIEDSNEDPLRDGCGYECNVDGDAAMAWLEEKRNVVYQSVCEALEEDIEDDDD